MVPFIVVVGFMLILIIEQTVLNFQVGGLSAWFSVPRKLKEILQDNKHKPEDEEPMVDASGGEVKLTLKTFSKL